MVATETRVRRFGRGYELTELANDRLFLWNARVVIINKVDNSQLTDESCMIFDYSRVIELLSGFYLELFSKVYDYLFNLRYSYLFLVDLKYVYLTIFLYFDDRYYFVFTIFGID